MGNALKKGEEAKQAKGAKASKGVAQKKNEADAGLPSKPVAAGGISHAMFIIDNPGKISEFYDLERKKLGEGSYGSVVRGLNKATKAERAVKQIAKKALKNPERFKQEVAIMKMMDHPNIIKLFESFDDHRNIYLVMELCSGGELFDRIIDAGSFTEVQAAILMQQIVRAIWYMHSMNICHRDLKPENFLFTTKDPIETAVLKIIDFGLSVKYEPGQVLTTKAGTPYYVAPQVLQGKYDQSSDVWSCGVIMYVMLCGYPPFYGDTDAEVLAKVRLGTFQFVKDDWKNISDEAKTLVTNMLKVNPKDRWTAEQALNDVWVKDKAPRAKNVDLSGGIMKGLSGFRTQHKLKKAALHIIASQLNEDKIKQLREVFNALDGNGDGLLTVDEMKEGLEKAEMDIPTDLKEMMAEVDADGSGVIDYTEFLAATLDRKEYEQEDVCWAAFRVFDRNGDGKISPEELQAVLGDDGVKDSLGADTIENLLKGVDADGDGNIDFNEFMTMMRRSEGDGVVGVAPGRAPGGVGAAEAPVVPPPLE